MNDDSLSDVARWQAAYLRFETPEQEIRKFERRLRAMRALEWPRDWLITEMFCGRGSGLHALSRLGFQKIQGLDRSPRLLSLYRGPGTIVACDCREIPNADQSQDVLVVQGGLHHLVAIPSDLERVLSESHRILRPGGLLCVVEPWRDPFLSAVHIAARSVTLRRVWPKLDALATMIECEAETYFNWLREPRAVLDMIHRWFVPEVQAVSWGKLRFIGRRTT